ncbi:MAG: FAD-dependent oxidoreductase, partial [Kiritimatiellia bacterium]
AHTRLIEAQGALGGIWTLGAMAHICGFNEAKGGLLCEIRDKLKARGAVGLSGRDFDIESTKLLLEELCQQAGVRVRLHTRVVAAQRDASNRVTAVLTESKSGREAWTADVIIDCTGDGDVAALAGCGFDVGSPEGGATQPMSLIAVVGGVALEQIRPFTNVRIKEPGADPLSHKNRLRRLLEDAGTPPSYSGPTLFHVYDDLYMLMSNHEYACSAMDADDLTRATMRGRSELHAQIAALRKLGGAWKNIRIVATSAQIGVREGRRIHGRYTITVDDLIKGARHDDAVTRCQFNIDVHSTNPAHGKGIDAASRKARPYDIPLRALIASDVDGLMMAGRCISGDFLAHASYRVTADAVPMGEAAGRTAA